MTIENDQLEYDRVTKKYQKEMDYIVDKINKEMKKESSEEKTNKIARLFLDLTTISKAKILVENVKPTQKQE
tara:strand:- start:10128 stop:10343 length:216 start_codon:yes stop_codon:yes gene_type:complete